MRDTAAVILAGGLARRMGGGDKALQVVGGQTILARTVAVLAPHAALVAISANGDPARFASYGFPVLSDPVAGHPGPLAGILAGMEWAAGQGMPWVLTVPGDCPFLPADLVPRLHAPGGSGVSMAASGGRSHFVTALWPTRLCDDLRAALDAGQRKVESFAAPRTTAVVDWPATPLDPFLNINTPGDLAAVERMTGQSRPGAWSGPRGAS